MTAPRPAFSSRICRDMNEVPKMEHADAGLSLVGRARSSFSNLNRQELTGLSAIPEEHSIPLLTRKLALYLTNRLA